MRVKEEEIIQSSTAQTRLLFHDSFEFVTKKANSKHWRDARIERGRA